MHIFVVFKNETATNIILKMLQTILATEYRNNTYFRFIKKIEGIMKISDKVPKNLTVKCYRDTRVQASRLIKSHN